MALWKKMPAPARDVLRRPARGDRWERDAVASRLVCYRDKTGDDWADIIDMPDDASGCATASRALARGDDASSDHVRGTAGGRLRLGVLTWRYRYTPPAWAPS